MFLKSLRGVEIKMLFLEGISQMLKYARYLKDILSNKKRLEKEVVNLPYQVRALAEGKNV